MVKINIDAIPQLSSALKVRSIPAVFLVSYGQVIDTFVGVPEDNRLEEFFKTAVMIQQLSHDDEFIQVLMDKVQDAL